MRPRLAGCLCLVLGIACVPTNDSNDATANFKQVSPGIFRGARPDQAGLERLSKMGLRTILNLENDKDVIESERQSAEALGLRFISVPMSGLWKPSDKVVDQALGALADPANRPIFVHCMKGQDRTGVVVALYHVVKESWQPTEADAEMHTVGFKDILVGLHHYFEHRTGFHRVNGRCGR